MALASAAVLASVYLFKRFDCYRAMLCIVRTVLSQDARLSVCHTPVFYRKAKHIIRLFSPLVSHAILVFSVTAWQYYEKVVLFQPISPFISEIIQDRAIVIKTDYSKSYVV